MILQPHETLSGLPFRILSFSEIDSTSRFLKEWGRRSPENGLVVVADFQTSGRGRWGRRWESPRGEGLCFSLLMAPVEVSVAPAMPLGGGVVLYDTLADVFPALNRSLELKWPNDLLLSGKKVAGILAELDYSCGEAAAAEATGKDPISLAAARAGCEEDSPAVSFVVLGIGVNCNQSRFPDDLPQATSLRLQLGTLIDRRLLLEAFLRRWHRCRLAAARSKEVVQEWKQRSSFWRGQAVRFAARGEVLQGTTCDVAPSGALVVRLDSGEERQILSGDVKWIRDSVNRGARDEDE